MNIVETPSKKDQVRNYLIQELNSGKYPPGSLFLSENVLFRELGICKNTVREALSSLVSDGLLERVRGKGTFVLEPRPNLAESTSAGVFTSSVPILIESGKAILSSADLCRDCTRRLIRSAGGSALISRTSRSTHTRI